MVKNINYRHSKKMASFLSVAALLLLGASEVSAQVKIPPTAYFQNQYLVNPAMAGIHQKSNLNASYGRMWNEVPGAPETMTFSGDFSLGDNMGAGLQVLHDKVGLLQKTRIMGSYAYHVPLSDAHRLHLGLSAGAVLSKIDRSRVVGEVNDPLLGGNVGDNNRFDADFGAAYTYDKRLTLQGTVSNMVSQFTDKEVLGEDYPTYFAAISYKTKLNVEDGAEAIGIEPKLVVQGRDSDHPIFGAGANLTFIHELLQVSAIYHSTHNFTFGLGINFQSRASALVMYETKPSDMKGLNTGDSFNFGLRYSF